MYKAAIDIANQINYQSLGTIEFIVDVQSRKDRTTFFLSRNEYKATGRASITEEILGLDLVELQINIALGKRLAMETMK
ncbi:MAG: hypothetical protein CM15mP98_05420 [Paracoccaceae bacterium]|nr:MAG: hypothetical protein CM15mP98_05420 [Paracoccaceae bacterium]